jgi:N-acetyl-alpha-D-muramate 1-phosphate uridylyltransferase
VVTFPVAILAGGLGTRLLPITRRIPKVLVPVAGKPFLAHQLTLLRSQGFKRVVLCVGHLWELVLKEFGDGQAFGMQLEYSVDGPVRLGTGGAIRKALPKLGEKFFVLNGDVYLPAPMRPAMEFFERSGNRAVMLVFKNNNLWAPSNVILRSGRIVAFNKQIQLPEMVYTDYGLSIFHSSVFREWIEGQSFDQSDVNKKLIASEELAAFEVSERFYEIGSHAGLAESEAKLRQVAQDLHAR